MEKVKVVVDDKEKAIAYTVNALETNEKVVTDRNKSIKKVQK